MSRVYIKENSFIAYVACKILKTTNVAIVINNTICLHNCTKQIFLEDKRWLSHELVHVQQWKRESIWLFPFKYVAYSLRYGYKKNPFELEAFALEKDYSIINKFNII